MTRPLRLAALLLAAGRAQRFGADKLLAALPDGTPLAVAAARALRGVVDEVVAVVRAHAAVAPLLAAEGMRVVVAAEADQGLGRSIAAGVRALEKDGADGHTYDACLVALADMPFVRPATIAKLVAALNGGASLVAPDYRGTRGHPVGLRREWFATLQTLQGDAGARDLLAVHREDLLRVPVNDAGVLADVDRPSDLAALLTARC